MEVLAVLIIEDILKCDHAVFVDEHDVLNAGHGVGNQVLGSFPVLCEKSLEINGIFLVLIRVGVVQEVLILDLLFDCTSDLNEPLIGLFQDTTNLAEALSKHVLELWGHWLF